MRTNTVTFTGLAFSDSSIYNDKNLVAHGLKSGQTFNEEILPVKKEENTHNKCLAKNPPMCNQKEEKVQEEIHAHDILNRMKTKKGDTENNDVVTRKPKI